MSGKELKMPESGTKEHVRVNIPAKSQMVLTLSGILETDSTKKLHTHASHQILVIDSGISLLVEENIKQPLFGSMAAFIPAGCPHRSIVIGEKVKYKSIYMDPGMMESSKKGIIIFEMSRLGAALFERIKIKDTSDMDKAINKKCMDLFLDILEDDLLKPARLVRLPVPRLRLNKEIVDYIEANFTKKLSTADFEKQFPYTHRHLSRIFKSDLCITIFDYLRLYRILSAVIMLSGDKNTIISSAYECGFESISSFYRDFKKVFGISPGSFLKNIGRQLYSDPEAEMEV